MAELRRPGEPAPVKIYCHGRDAHARRDRDGTWRCNHCGQKVKVVT